MKKLVNKLVRVIHRDVSAPFKLTSPGELDKKVARRKSKAKITYWTDASGMHHHRIGSEVIDKLNLSNEIDGVYEIHHESLIMSEVFEFSLPQRTYLLNSDGDVMISIGSTYHHTNGFIEDSVRVWYDSEGIRKELYAKPSDVVELVNELLSGVIEPITTWKSYRDSESAQWIKPFNLYEPRGGGSNEQS